MNRRFFLSKERVNLKKKANQRIVKRKFKNGRTLYILRRKRVTKRRKKKMKGGKK